MLRNKKKMENTAQYEKIILMKLPIDFINLIISFQGVNEMQVHRLKIQTKFKLNSREERKNLLNNCSFVSLSKRLESGNNWKKEPQ